MPNFLVVNTKTGLQRDLKEFLIPDDAYPNMTDFYVFRGRIQRRKGFKTLGRLNAYQVQNIAAFPGAATGTFNNVTTSAPIFPGSLIFYIIDSANAVLRTFIDTGEGALFQYPTPALSIVSISNALNAQIETATPHGLLGGEIVVFRNVEGLTTPLSTSAVNEQGFTVTAIVSPTEFQIGLDTSADDPHTPNTGEVSLGGTIDYTTGAFSFTIDAIGGVAPYSVRALWYLTTFPCLPVMGIRSRELPQGQSYQETIWFDTEKANVFDDVANAFQDITFHKTTNNQFSWTGDNADFFWSTNYASAFWATNFTPGLHASPTTTLPGEGDGIRWYDGSTPFSEGWVNFNPLVTSTDYLQGCRLIVPYYGRLVVLNTYEGQTFPGKQYPQRARWCQIGTPYVDTGPPVIVPVNFQGSAQADAWRSDIPGKGGFLDAPTSEHITGAAFYKDQLVVFFERSTWVLLYTGNPILPFIFERVNAQFGCESPFSPVIFDQGVLAIGDKAIITASGTNVVRIDEKIPDEVFNFQNSNDGPSRVQGIRDFFSELVYWNVPTFASTEQGDDEQEIESTFPTRLMVYNYREGAFSYFKDAFTALGYFQSTKDLTWDEADVNWDDADFNWDGSPSQSRFPSIAAGNNQGYGMILHVQDFNDPSQTITNFNTASPQEVVITTCNNHCLETNDFIMITDAICPPVARGPETAGSALAGATSFTGFTARRAVVPGTVQITVGANTFTDPLGDGVLVPNSGKICYSSGEFTVYFSALAAPSTPVTVAYDQTINGGVYKVQPLTATTLLLLDYDATGLAIPAVQEAFLTVVNNVFFQTKRFTPFLDAGKQVRFQYVDWYLERTVDGEFTVNILYNDVPEPVTDGEEFIVNTKPDGSVNLDNDMQQFQERIWHRMFLSGQGDFIQMQLTLSDEQMICPEVCAEPINIHGMMLYCQPTGRLPS